jgi:hypothetical protein
VADNLQNVNFPHNPHCLLLVLDSVLFKYFDSYLLASGRMCTKSDFTKCPLAKGFPYKQKKVKQIQNNLNEGNFKLTDYIVANFSALTGFTLCTLRSLLITSVLFGIRRLLVIS